MQQIPHPLSTSTDVPIEGVNKIYFFDTVDSTNTIAKVFSQQGEPDGSVVVAKQQIKGRGRHARTWVSTVGGLYFSVLLRPPCTAYLSLFPLLSAVSVASTLASYQVQAAIKWPNDVHIKGKKIAGILVESSLQANHVDYVIVGIGLNVNQTRDHFPQDLSATSLFLEKGEPVDEQQLLYHMLSSFQTLYHLWRQEEYEQIIMKWKQWTDTVGKEVEIHLQKDILQGKAVDVDSYGRLLLNTGDQQHVISSGDCLYLKQKTKKL